MVFNSKSSIAIKMVCVFLLVSLSVGIPQYSIIFISSQNESQMQNFTRMLNDDKDKLCKIIHEYEVHQSDCKKLYAPLQNALSSDGSNINNIIKKVSKYSEYLFVICDHSLESLDFNNLPNQNIVFIEFDQNMFYTFGIQKFGLNHLRNLTVNTIKAIYGITSNINDEKAKSFSALCQKIIGPIEKTDQQKSSEKYLKLSIEGNIKDKVSCLIIKNIKLNIVNNDLNINSLFMYDSALDENSKNIRTTFFLMDPQSIIDEESQDKVHVEQYGRLMIDRHNSDHYIYFYDDQYCVASTYYGHIGDFCYVARKSYGNIFNLIARGNYFRFILEGQNLGQSTLNITLMDYNPRVTLLEDVMFYPYGNWTNISEKPKIIITYKSDDFSIDTSYLENMGFLVEHKSSYSYVPLDRQPFRLKPKYIGIICGILFVVVLTIILIIIAVIYRPQKEISMEEELEKEIENI